MPDGCFCGVRHVFTTIDLVGSCELSRDSEILKVFFYQISIFFIEHIPVKSRVITVMSRGTTAGRGECTEFSKGFWCNIYSYIGYHLSEQLIESASPLIVPCIYEPRMWQCSLHFPRNENCGFRLSQIKHHFFTHNWASHARRVLLWSETRLFARIVCPYICGNVCPCISLDVDDV